MGAESKSRSTIVVRKNSTTLMQRERGGCTRDEVHSGPGAPQLGLIGRNDVSGVANARGNLGADRAGPAPKKSVVGRDCNAGAKSAKFFADAPRSRGSSNPDTHAGVFRLVFRKANSPWGCAGCFNDFEAQVR
jgi:hypothetical protein